MTAVESEQGLTSAESREVGRKAAPGSESVGHDSGRKIIKLPP